MLPGLLRFLGERCGQQSGHSSLWSPNSVASGQPGVGSPPGHGSTVGASFSSADSMPTELQGLPLILPALPWHLQRGGWGRLGFAHQGKCSGPSLSRSEGGHSVSLQSSRGDSTTGATASFGDEEDSVAGTGGAARSSSYFSYSIGSGVSFGYCLREEGWNDSMLDSTDPGNHMYGSHGPQ